MSVEFWVAQGLGVAVIVLTILAFWQREKWKMMLCNAATNAMMIAIYILLGSLLGGLLVAGALVRTVVYFLYNRMNKRPDMYILILFEIYNVVISLIFWNSLISLFMIANLVVVTFTSWQKDVKTLRFGYIFSSLMLIPFDIMLGAYTTAVAEVIMLASVLYSLIKYAKSSSTSSNYIQRYFVANRNFWGSNVETNENFDLVVSNTVDTAPYYNFGIIKNEKDLYKTILEIKAECRKNNLKEVAYIQFKADNFDEKMSDAHTLQMFFPLVFHDVWMKLIDGFNLNNTHSKIQGVEYKEIDDSCVNQIIDVYMKGYISKTDKKDLTKNEKMQIANLEKLQLGKEVNGYVTTAYIAYYSDEPIAMIVMLDNGEEAFVTKVSTIPVFRRKHIASSLIQYAVKKLRAKGVQNFMLCTDKYSTSEKVYAFNSFVEVSQAFAFDVSDMTKYENYLGNDVLPE